MATYRVSRSGSVPAPAARVYAVIADYGRHHPHIVPPRYFRSLEVLQGGVGAGTRTRVQMQVLGTTRVFEQVVTEPEPGRLLQEENSDGFGSTTFRVDPEGAGGAQLTITTELAARPGLAGALERFMTTLMLRRIYREEIARLAEYVKSLPA